MKPAQIKMSGCLTISPAVTDTLPVEMKGTQT